MLLVTGAVLSACSSPLASVPDSSATNPQPTDSTQLQPNVAFDVTATSGTCPDAVALWEFLLAFEGGADHTVVPDFSAIAVLPTEIIRAEERQVTYQAPLSDTYATCVGTAQSDRWSMYTLRFEAGQVYFDLDLTQGDGYRDILYTGISAGRPYIHWRAAE